MQLDEALAERQAQPRACILSGATIINLLKHSKYLVEVLFLDPDSSVGDADLEVLTVPGHLAADRDFALFRKFASVAAQVGDDLHDALAVGLDHDRLALVQELHSLTDNAALALLVPRVLEHVAHLLDCLGKVKPVLE